MDDGRHLLVFSIWFYIGQHMTSIQSSDLSFRKQHTLTLMDFSTFFLELFRSFSVIIIVAGSPVANEWTNGKWLDWLIGSLDAFSFYELFDCLSSVLLAICVGTCSWASTRVKWWSKPWPKDWSLTVWRICAVLGIGWTLSSFSPVTPHWPSRSAISPDCEPSAYSAHSKPFPSSQVRTHFFVLCSYSLLAFSLTTITTTPTTIQVIIN